MSCERRTKYIFFSRLFFMVIFVDPHITIRFIFVQNARQKCNTSTIANFKYFAMKTCNSFHLDRIQKVNFTNIKQNAEIT